MKLIEFGVSDTIAPPPPVIDRDEGEPKRRTGSWWIQGNHVVPCPTVDGTNYDDVQLLYTNPKLFGLTTEDIVEFLQMYSPEGSRNLEFYMNWLRSRESGRNQSQANPMSHLEGRRVAFRILFEEGWNHFEDNSESSMETQFHCGSMKGFISTFRFASKNMPFQQSGFIGVIIADPKRMFAAGSGKTVIFHAEKNKPTPYMQTMQWINQNAGMVSESFSPQDLEGGQMEDIFSTFEKSYVESTGQSWSRDKFMRRAAAWTFYGTQGGYLAVRAQRRGMKKLVGMAGNAKGIYRGFQELMATGGPIWGAVSAEIVPMAVKLGMIAPHTKFGGPTAIKLLVSRIGPEVFGDAQVKVDSDGGLTITYPDVGTVKKYIIGNKEYFRFLINNPEVRARIAKVPLLGGFIRKLIG